MVRCRCGSAQQPGVEESGESGTIFSEILQGTHFSVKCFRFGGPLPYTNPLLSQGKYAEADPLYKRTQEIWEKSLGRDHLNVATILNNRARLLESQVSRKLFGLFLFCFVFLHPSDQCWPLSAGIVWRKEQANSSCAALGQSRKNGANRRFRR